MKLSDARRYAVRHRTKIEFATSSGTPVTIDEHGIARVEGLRSAPDFTVSEEFDRADKFSLIRGTSRESVERNRLAELAGKAAAHAHDEDE